LISIFIPIIGAVLAILSLRKWKQSGSAEDLRCAKYAGIPAIVGLSISIIVIAIGSTLPSSPPSAAPSPATRQPEKKMNVKQAAKPKAIQLSNDSLKQQVSDAISSNRNFGGEAGSPLSDWLEGVSVKDVDYDADSHEVMVSLQLKEMLDSTLFIDDLGIAHTVICEKLFTYPKISAVITTEYITTTDDFGNEKQINPVTITWNKKTSQKINFSNFEGLGPGDQAYRVADDYVIAQSLWEEYKHKDRLNNVNVKFE
jgi:hypothetical protein